MFGWTGRTVIVDLGNNAITESRTKRKDAEKFIGGRGMGCTLMDRMAETEVGPFSPDNPIIFSTGPLTGTSAPLSGHFSICTRSPITRTIFDSNSGGSFGAEMKFAGIDSLVITGKSETPVYLHIEDEEIELLPADHLWGKNTTEITGLLESRGKVACIGKAGEKMIPMASMVNDRIYPGGRGGHGAVMGSKNLKAVVVKGSNVPEIADIDAFDKAVERANRLLVANPPASKGLASYGTPVFVNLLSYMGILPADNFRKKEFAGAQKISGEFIRENYEIHKTPCDACPIGCKRTFNDGTPVPDYDAVWTFGPNIGNDDLRTIIELNSICLEYGLDPVSCGASIAAYMELNSFTAADLDLKGLLREIGEGKSELSVGSYSYLCSKGAKDISMSVMGLEISGYDPREMAGMALAYATSNRGGCHLNAFMVAPEIMGKPMLLKRQGLDGKAALVQYFQNLSAVIDSLVICPFTAFAMGEVELAALLSAATGVDRSAEELLCAGERIYNLERVFNRRPGIPINNDTLPDRFFGKDGIDKEMFERALSEYHHFRGWNENGVPTRKKLGELSIAGETGT
ncbi:aldehyde ferredoxin oxidoreductase family protein [Methanolobus halotolerans]|uniref:Aldehyde ferredoxin oxidoreductase n=1 Tax=Methanolobus halotolerans TaxID=2052935 RepID=A0A4E0PWJ2_9EURY|nr:aldehyde ferredoxin oxidoreductase family protein [Methanolobus halotolerans]TGC08927.1 aldehyde ferredoxin oxidoreductase [Methanolobus halotolerans]